MKPIRRILVPFDFSDASRHALNYGLHLAEAFSAELELLHVIPHGHPSGKDREAKDREMASLIPRNYADLPSSVRTTSGEPEEKILEAVESASVDLVVMGSHGRRRFARWLIGSVTERILRQVPVPILTVSRIEDGLEPPVGAALAFRHIFCPTDFSDSTEVALPMAVEFARKFDAVLEVAHVVEHIERSPTSPPYTDEEIDRKRRELNEWAGSRLAEILTQVETGDLTIQKTVLEGRASDVLVEHIEVARPDLVVMTLHGMSFLERALLGATAERVIRTAPVPVLSIPRVDADTSVSS